MIPGHLYYTIYLIAVSILTFVVANMYINRNYDTELKEASSFPIFSLVLTIIVTLFIGNRPIYSGFVDMYNYNELFNFTKNKLDDFAWNWDATNLLFDNFFYWSAKTFDDSLVIFNIFSIVYFGGIFIACRRMYPGNTFAVLLVYLAAFSTFTYATNGVKAGLAASIFLLALTFYNKKWVMILIAVLSMGIHHSMQLCLATLIIVIFYNNPRFYLGVWIISFFLALFHITAIQDIFASLTDEQGTTYLEGDFIQTEKGFYGFRIDFVLYSFTPILIGIYAIRFRGFKSKMYDFLLSLYLLTNSVWLVCMYANFNNRIAYLSWLMLPFVLVYPVLHPKWGDSRYKSFVFLMVTHLLFTLFMHFVYYG